MLATVMHKAGDVRIETIPDAVPGGRRMGHEAIGVVEAVGREVPEGYRAMDRREALKVMIRP